MENSNIRINLCGINAYKRKIDRLKTEYTQFCLWVKFVNPNNVHKTVDNFVDNLNSGEPPMDIRICQAFREIYPQPVNKPDVDLVKVQ